MKDKTKKPFSTAKYVRLAILISLVAGLIISGCFIRGIYGIFSNVGTQIEHEVRSNIKGDESVGDYTVKSRINNLTVNWYDGTVKFIFDEKAKNITVSEKSDETIASGCHMYIFESDNMLSVSCYGKNAPDKSKEDKDLTITFPAEYKKEALKNIKLNFADCEFSGSVYSQKINGDFADCEVKVTGGSFKSADISDAGGELYFSNTEAYDFDCNGAGSSITICYPAGTKFKAENNSIGCKTEISGFEFSQNGNTYVCGDGSDAVVSLNTFGGSVKIIQSK